MRAKPINIDDNQNSFFYARNMNIQLSSSHSIETPYRALSNSDLSAKAKIPSDIALLSEISGIHNDLYVNDVEKLITDNAAVAAKIRNIENYRQRMQHSSMVFALLQPCKTARQHVLINDKLREKFLEIIIQMQILANFDYICVPWVGFTSIESTIKQFRKIENSCDKELIFFLDLESEPPFLEQISNSLTEMIDSDKIHSIGLVHHPVEMTLVSHIDLWNIFKEKNAAIIVANIERYNENFDALSSIHLNEFILGDIFLPRVNHPFGVKKETAEKKTKTIKPKPSIKEKLRFFNHNSLTVSPISVDKSDKWINSVTTILSDPRIKEAINNYPEAELDKEKFNVISAISKVYEHIASSEELQSSKKFINSGESKDYLDNKPILAHALKKSVGALKRRRNFF